MRRKVKAANDDAEQMPSKRKAAEMILAAAHAGQGGWGAAMDFARKGNLKYAQKALGQATGSAGGYLVEPEFGEHIDLLFANSAVRKLGANEMPMPNGNLVFPGDASGATAYWVGENANATESAPTFQQVSLSAKQVRVIVPLSNQLINDTSGKALAHVERLAEKAAVLAEDLAFLKGTGSVYQPRGMFYQASTNKFDITHSGSTATFSEMVADLGRAIGYLADANVPEGRWGWIMHPRSARHIKFAANSLGIREFYDEMKGGQLLGFPFQTTTQISKTLDVSTDGSDDESEIYLANFDLCYIGDVPGVELEAFRGGAYYGTGGSVVSGISLDQTAVVFSKRLDFGCAHQGAEVCVIEEVDWA
jgi:HK97 family phage major capsid protein